ncbi:ATP-binding protein [Haloarcula sp. S1CR25-12]|uniref:histidine kinase n=1 Tax=Haloarcula saliterrae TaxID=2950534 RepID=A0ABU2FHH4_9EURY|nr:histidine kinase N-terminal 7TM domain-containing protein [Haloarcula sp. S1CR25-12]MDS0261709.1 ATP-binding protein [Haloarcula sp. S1CR25-12]
MVGLIGGSLVGLSIASGIASVGLALYLSRHRGRPGATWFMASLTAQGIWAVAYGLGLTLTDPGLRAAAEALAWIGMNCTGPFFLAFALEYTGRSTVTQNRWVPVLLLSPMATLGLGVTHPLHTLLWRDFRFASVFDLGTVLYSIQPLGYVTVILSLSMAGIGVLLLVETMLAYGKIYRRETVAIVLSPIPASIPLLVWLGQIGPYPQLNFTPALLLTHVTLDAYAFSSTSMFETNPVTQRAAERSAVDDLDDPLLVVDGDQRVVKLNDSAQALFEISMEQLPRSFAALVGTDLDTLRTTGDLSLDSRTYGVSYTPLETPDGGRVGGIVVLYDITTERNQRQQLSVLNRVLRHNLRNEMTIVRGHADSVQSNWTDSQLLTQMNSIIGASDRLLSISEQMRDFEQVVDREIEQQAVDCLDFIETVRMDVRDTYPEASVAVVADAAPDHVRTDPTVLSLALSTLVENAIRHSDDPVPTVELFCSDDDADETVIFQVKDTNDRIPENELAALGADEEQPLQHGRSIGLWIVNWAVTAVGGQLRFQYESGNVATIELPADTHRD